MTSYANDFTLHILEAEARANQLCCTLVRWADGKQLAIAPQKSSVILFTSDTHQSRLHPQVRIGDAVAPLNRTPKIQGVTLDTLFTFSPHARDCVERASRALNVMNALAGSNLCFTTETLVATYKANVRLMLNYDARIRFTQVSSSHLGKPVVIQNKALRIVTACHQKAAASHIRAEWSNLCFTTETLVATYKAKVRPMLNYDAPIRFTQVFSSHLGKLVVIQNKALRIATACHQKAAASHIRAETGVCPEGTLRNMLSTVLCSALPSLQLSHLIATSPSEPRSLRAMFQSSYHRILEACE